MTLDCIWYYVQSSSMRLKDNILSQIVGTEFLFPALLSSTAIIHTIIMSPINVPCSSHSFTNLSLSAVCISISPRLSLPFCDLLLPDGVTHAINFQNPSQIISCPSTNMSNYI